MQRIKESVKKKLNHKHPLFAQVGFTVLAFLIMVGLSYHFASSLVTSSLLRYKESVFSIAQAQIKEDMAKGVSTLGGFSQTIRTMILRGDSISDIQMYLNDMSGYLSDNEIQVPGISDLFCLIEAYPEGNVLLNSVGWVMPDDYDLEQRQWYLTATAGGSDVVVTEPYESIYSGRLVVSYTRAIFDDDGRRLGIICLNARVSEIGQPIVETALDRDGYGMLLDRDMVVLAHSNPDLIGIHLQDPVFPLSIHADDILAGRAVELLSLKSGGGEDSVAFIREMPNGWHLGLVTPTGPFYRGVVNMMMILCSLGAALAAVLVYILVRIDRTKTKSDAESKQKSAFLANMSHEMRTPMNAIIGMTALAKSAGDVERKDYCLSKIDDASLHLLGVINDILDMSKIEANKFELSSAEFIFEKMLHRVVNVVNFRVEEKQQKLSVNIDRAIPENLVGDDQRLAQVITNLLGNAVKFTPERGSITLNTSLLEAGDGYCVIQVSVSDTGIGITAEQQAGLFKAFQQAESSTSRKYGGTGLGLSISRSIVEMMNGRIWVESEPGNGSAFFFTVRLGLGQISEDSILGKNDSLSNFRFLAVDDDPDVLKFFKELLWKFGFQCDTAQTAEEALQCVYNNDPYDICFIDWKLPYVDGMALAKAIRNETDKLENTIVIMISAAEWNTIKDEAIDSGVKKFISKPLFPSDIANTINEALGLKQIQIEDGLPDYTGMFEGRHIMLAEDVEINREIVMAILEPTGILIDCAENGAEAVRMFGETPDEYDLILMDLQMPVMDGFEATRRIRKMEEAAGGATPIIALTANVFREDIERCMEAGMSGHLGKPLAYDEVMSKLCSCLLSQSECAGSRMIKAS